MHQTGDLRNNLLKLQTDLKSIGFIKNPQHSMDMMGYVVFYHHETEPDDQYSESLTLIF